MRSNRCADGDAAGDQRDERIDADARREPIEYGPGAGEHADELRELRPKTLGDWFFRKRRPRTLRDGRVQTPDEALDEDLANMRRVSMPSILEILQVGAGSLGW